FFSSRRRHTRSKRDWSSDVCSSDLAQGSGLGLNIVAAIATAHGGDIRVESSPGAGSIFIISIPLDPHLETPETTDTLEPVQPAEIGRASCRESVHGTERRQVNDKTE